jgi:hypothetical protein
VKKYKNKHMKKVAILQLILFVSTSIAFAQEKVTNRNGKEITVNVPASSTTQGVVKLAGDLGGTADVPTVPALTNKLEGSGTINYIPKFTATKTLGNSLLFENGTNVGLGTITPVSLFEISDASETFTGNGTLRISNSSNPTVNKFAGLVFKSNNVSGVGGSWKIGSNQETTTSYEQIFHFLNSYNGSTYASKMTLTPSGNLGVGTTSPGNKLEITQGTAGNSGLRFTNLNSASTATTSSSKVLALNSSGDVILTNVPGTQNIVAFSTATPTTSGVVFTPATPADQSVVYQSSVDNSMWTYNGTTYVTYTAPASTAWYTSSTTNDAGNSKTSNIYRTGNVGIGVSAPSVPLDVQSTAVSTFVTTAKFLTPSNTTAGNSNVLNFGVSATTGNSADWRYVYQGNGATSNRVDFGMSGYTSPMMSYLTSGNVGIGTTAPLTKLHIQGIQTTLGANANATMLRMSRTTYSGYKWGSAAQFNLGTYDDGVNPGNSKSRLDLALTNVDETALTNVMTWLGNGNVGINNTAPVTNLQVQGIAATDVINADAQVLRLSRPTTPTVKWDNIAQFNLGAYATEPTGKSARTRLDLAMNDGASTTTGNVMTWQANGNVGIGTTAPTTNLDVVGGFSLRNTVGTAGSNYGMEFNTNSNSPRIDWVYNGTYIGQFSSDANDFLLRNSKQSLGGFRFYTNPSGSQVERLTILNSGNIGIGSTAPVSKLETIQSSLFSDNETATHGFLVASGKTNTDYAFYMGADKTNGLGYVQALKWGVNYAPFSLNPRGGNVGIGVSNPTSKFEVNGSATNTTAYNSGSATAILFNNSNLAYTSASPTAFSLQGMKDGGTYTLAVQGTTSGTSSFIGLNPAGTSFTFKSINNGVTIAGKDTLYTFVVMGTTVYVYMATGF